MKFKMSEKSLFATLLRAPWWVSFLVMLAVVVLAPVVVNYPESKFGGFLAEGGEASAKKTLVEMYDSKKKRREEEAKAALKFNQKPQDGLKYAAERGHLDLTDPVDVARG